MKSLITVAALAVAFAIPAQGADGPLQTEQLKLRIRRDAFDPALAQSATNLLSAISRGDSVAELESAAYRLYLDADRFRNVYSRESWNAIKDVVTTLLERAGSAIESQGGSKTSVSNVQRYSLKVAGDSTKTR